MTPSRPHMETTTLYYLSLSGQPYRVRDAQVEAFTAKGGWFTSCLSEPDLARWSMRRVSWLRMRLTLWWRGRRAR